MNTNLVLSISTTIATCIVCFAMTRKIWYAPILGLLHEGIWVVFALSTPNAWPIIGAAIVYSILYAFAIPKWYKERINQ